MTAPFRSGPGAIAVILCLACATSARAGDLAFDGKHAAVALDSVSDHFTGADVARISLAVAPSWQPDDAAVDPAYSTPDVTLLQLAAVNDILLLSIGEQAGVLNLSNALPGGSLDIQVDPKRRQPTTLELVRQADQTWLVRADGRQAGSLDKTFFAPDPHDRLHLQLGGPGFIGRIEGFEIDGASGAPVVAVNEAGALELARPFSPRLGSYFLVDGLDNIPARLSIEGVGEHGLFERKPYFALVRRHDELGLVFDWGGYLALAHDQTEPNVLVPKNQDDAWAGRLRFPRDPTGTFSSTVFIAENVNARPGVAFLQTGKRYQRIEDRLNVVAQTPVGQKLGEVFTSDQLPSNFQFSQEGCFDVRTMDLADLQQTGCRSSLFEFPPIASSDYSTPDKKVVPSGWRYQSYRDFLGGFTSSIATSSDELENLRSAGSSASLNVMGVKAHHNTSTEQLRGQTIERETSVSLHQFSSSAFVTILNPLKVYLNHCFIRHVARAAPGAGLPSYFSPTVTEKYGYDDRIGEACPEELWLPLADAGTPDAGLMAANAEKLIELHGTHYAYAITYGARGEQQTTFSKSALSSLANDKTNVDDGIGLELQQKIEGVPVNAGATIDQTSARAANAKLLATDGVTRSRYECVGGSSCTEGKPEISDSAIPIYLHLRPIDELLAPPYFDDPEIVIDFRQAVRKALAKKLEETPAAAPTAIKLVRITVDDVRCSNDQWWLGDRLCQGDKLQSTIENMALVAYGRHADGTAEYLGDTPIVMPLATAANGFVVPVVINPKHGQEVVEIGFKLVPAGYRPASAAALPKNCGAPDCQLAVWVSSKTADVPDNAPLDFFLKTFILPLAAVVVGPGTAKPDPYRNLEAKVGASGSGLHFWLEPDFIGVDPRDLARYHRTAHRTTRALALNNKTTGPVPLEISHLDLNVAATFEIIDATAALGFSEGHLTSALLPLPLPTELSDAAARRNEVGAWQIGLFNDGHFVVQYHVSYEVDGETRRVASNFLPYRDYQLIGMPQSAENIAVQGQVVTGLDQTRTLFEQEVVAFGDGIQPQACFHISGAHPDQAAWNARQRRDPRTGEIHLVWEPGDCWSPIAIASQLEGHETRPPRDADPMPRYIDQPLPAPVAVTLPPPPVDPLQQALVEPVTLADLAPGDAGTTARSGPGLVTFFNQSGYVAEFSVAYRSGGDTVRRATGRMALGQRRSVPLPADATDILVVGDAIGLIGDKRFLQQPLPHPHGATCFKSYGTVFKPAWNHNC